MDGFYLSKEYQDTHRKYMSSIENKINNSVLISIYKWETGWKTVKTVKTLDKYGKYSKLFDSLTIPLGYSNYKSKLFIRIID